MGQLKANEILTVLEDAKSDGKTMFGKNGEEMTEKEMIAWAKKAALISPYKDIGAFKAALEDGTLDGLKASLSDDFRVALSDVGTGAKDGTPTIHIHNNTIMGKASEMSAAEKEAADKGLRRGSYAFLKDQGITVKNVAVAAGVFLFGKQVLTFLHTRSEADCQKACMQQQQIAPDGTNVEDVGGWGPMCPLEKTTKAECAVYCSTTKPGACSLEERDKRGATKCEGMKTFSCMSDAADSLMDQVSKFWKVWGFRIQMALFVLFGLCMLHYVVGLGKDLFGRGVSSAKSTFTYTGKNKAEVGAGYRKKMGKRK